LSWYRHHLKVFTIHYVTRINWRIHGSGFEPESGLDRIRSVLWGRIRIRFKLDRIPNTWPNWSPILPICFFLMPFVYKNKQLCLVRAT
jgi:hypothetical protein